MGFGEAVRTGLQKYATFKGRARRSEYWWFALFLALVYVAGAVLDALAGTQGALMFLTIVALLLPSISVTVRRLHDTGRSGGWYFIAFVPLIGGIWLLVLTCLDSSPYDNSYGPSPKYGMPTDGAWAPSS